MAGHAVILCGASAGGVEAMTRIVRDLPPDIPAAVFVTLHFPEYSTSVLPRILARASSLPAEHARTGDTIQAGRIYVAPPDYHLLVRRGEVQLARGPRENGHRPAIDPMFRSAAVAYGARAIGVVLSGNLDDGTAGLLAIKRHGGIAVVQDPQEALFPSMPASAKNYVDVDHVLGLDVLGPRLTEIARQLAGREPNPNRLEHDMKDHAARETAYDALDLSVIEDVENHPGDPSQFGCPDCGGVLWQIRDGHLVRYRCRVGHAWSSDSLLVRQSEQLDAALWLALRTLEENLSLVRSMAERARRRDHQASVERYDRNAEELEVRIRTIREVLVRGSPVAHQEDPNTLPAHG